jgi:hypothetical protein
MKRMKLVCGNQDVRRFQVASVHEVRHLSHLSLRVLWLSDNPCASEQDYRKRVLQMLPSLHKLDNIDIPSKAPLSFVNVAASTMSEHTITACPSLNSRTTARSNSLQVSPQKAQLPQGAPDLTPVSPRRIAVHAASHAISSPDLEGVRGREEQDSAMLLQSSLAASPPALHVARPFELEGGKIVQRGQIPDSVLDEPTFAPVDIDQAPARSNVRQAVMALVDELARVGDVDSLQLVQQECASRLGFIQDGTVGHVGGG